MSESDAGSSRTELDSVPALLLSWGMSSEVIQIFIDEDFSFESLELLTETRISQLIPKAGPQTLFLSKFQTWKKSKVLPKDSFSVIDDDDVIETRGRKRLPSSTIQSSPKKRSTESSLGQTKKFVKLSLSQSEPSINEVHKLLKSTFEGITILAAYNTFHKLDEAHRELLAKRVIIGEIKLDFSVDSRIDARISVERLLDLANLIQELFPTETSVTYCCVSVVDRVRLVSGRLRNKLYNIRRTLIKIGLVEKQCLQRELEIDADLDDPTNYEDDENILWLKNHTFPWPQVQDKWQDSLQVRKKFCALMSPYDIINCFPALKKKFGYELLVNDWNTEYPHLSSDFLMTKWPKVLNFCKQSLKRKEPSFLRHVVPDGDSDGDVVTDSETVHILTSLARLFKLRNLPSAKKPATKRKSKQKQTKKTTEQDKEGSQQQHWRPTFEEVQEAFVLHLEEPNLLEETVKSRQDILKSKGLSLQPFVALIGPKSEIRQSLVLVDNTMWECPSPLEAVQICLQVFFSLSTSYPPEARHVWLFLQQVLCDLQLSDDYRGDPHLKSYIAPFVNDFRNFA